MLSKLILEKYLNNRFNAGVAKGREEGRQQANEEWHAWYNRMVEAKELGEEFDEPPPAAPTEER